MSKSWRLRTSLYGWDASIFPHLPVEEDDKGVDLLDLLLQELHQLLHSLTIALNIISKAWLDLDRKQLTDLITNLNLDFGLSSAWSVNNCYRFLVVAIPPEPIRVTKLHLIFTAFFAHLSLPWSNAWLSSSIFPCSLVCPAMVTPDQISTFFNIYSHKSVVLTQFHLISSCTKLHWPSTTKYQPVPPHTDPVPPNTN